MSPKRVCPKCGSTPGLYIENWTGFSMTFGADANGNPNEGGFLHEGHPSGKVLAVCAKCCARWTLRGVRQITDLRPKEGR